MKKPDRFAVLISCRGNLSAAALTSLCEMLEKEVGVSELEAVGSDNVGATPKFTWPSSGEAFARVLLGESTEEEFCVCGDVDEKLMVN